MTTKIKSGVIAAGAVDASALSDNSITIAHLNCSDGTNGQVLTTDGSGTLSFTDMTGGVDGIVSSADATAITIDSSENVGIGNTPNALFKLDVEGAVKTNGSGFYVSENYSSGNNVYRIYENSNEFRIESQIIGTAFDNSSPIVFATSNADGRLARMTINSDGNVGIGLTPLYSGNGTARPSLEIGGSTEGSLAFNGTGKDGLIITNSKNIGGVFKAAHTGLASAYGQTAGEHIWYTAASVSADSNQTFNERMRIDSAGDITMSGTGSLKIPSGTTAQRPSSPTVGMIRYNTSNSEVEGYIGSDWKSFSTTFVASGGTETDATISGVTYRIHAFTSSGTFQVTAGSSNIDVLIVAGGGGGGGSTAGGGGAGGLIYQAAVGVLVGSYTITVGAGGAGSRRADAGSANNTNGANTTAFGYTALGGGYGYSGAETGSRLANSGGSGGGGGAYNGNDITTSSGAAGTSGQGFAGGAGNDGGNWGGGGGGGATAVGVDQTGTRAGGAGSDRSSIYATTYGESGVFAGGGGGGAYNNGVTQGGTGGGGNGGDGQTHVPTAGSANTGGGGGGGGFYQYGPGGGAGGSGIVIIRYQI
jgi:hypothetical protein